MARLASRQLFCFAVASLLLALHGIPQAGAIQVAPNSPCASLCIDDSSLDTSDPNSSNTDAADLSCQDESFSSTTKGKKWSSCMGCLQNSTFVQGSESDQAWFFYNLRYNFDYCIFGYPNGSEVASSPCQTSTACGPLLDSLTKGIPSMGSESEFSYCGFVDGSNVTSASFDACMSCISASSSSNILTNSLIALQAGCQQQLPDNEAVGLSGSVFAATSIISIVSPTASSSSSSTGTASGTSRRVTTTTIAIIVVVALLVVAAISGFVVVCLHKRKRTKGRRQSGAAGRGGDGVAEKTAGGGGGGGIGPVRWASSIENITSPLSFQCRADRTSAASFATSAASSFHSMAGVSPQEQQLPWQQQHQQQQQQQQTAMAGGRKKHGKPQQLLQQALEADSSGAHLPAIAESPFPSPAGATTSSSPTRTGPPARPVATALPRLYQLKTSFGPPTSSTRNNGSRYDSCNSGTPTSATALLSHPASAYTPASSSSAAALSRHGSPASATTLMTPQLHTPSSAGGLAPYVPSAYIPGSSALHPPQPPQPPQQQRSHPVGASPQSAGHLPAWSSAAAAAPSPRQKHRRASSNDFGSPVDSRATRTAFPPPPQQRGRR